jgi:hypothetical protein
MAEAGLVRKGEELNLAALIPLLESLNGEPTVTFSWHVDPRPSACLLL